MQSSNPTNPLDRHFVLGEHYPLAPPSCRPQQPNQPIYPQQDKKKICYSHSAMDDIPRADEIRTLVKDIWDLRVAKLRSSVDTFVRSDSAHAMVCMLKNINLNEI